LHSKGCPVAVTSPAGRTRRIRMVFIGTFVLFRIPISFSDTGFASVISKAIQHTVVLKA
jgi:hypothetical protein